ncbi:MAG: DUF3467 domain-containing protein [Proteobacteria bacterium]|nr:DUF3467 domain-containing protein [Pseudomonadota bacterium]
MPDQPQMQINTADEMSRGRYSNSMAVAHGPEEFIIDWFLQSPNGAHLVSRIVVTPGHMKRIMQALQENLEKYENTFGIINVVESPNPIVQ